MVISETLRLYPPVIRFDRVASVDYQLGDYSIPQGFLINVPVYPIHHDPNHWPNPEKFIPERYRIDEFHGTLNLQLSNRFLPGEKAQRHPMSYLPFGDGPR